MRHAPRSRNGGEGRIAETRFKQPVPTTQSAAGERELPLVYNRIPGAGSRPHSRFDTRIAIAMVNG